MTTKNELWKKRNQILLYLIHFCLFFCRLEGHWETILLLFWQGNRIALACHNELWEYIEERICHLTEEKRSGICLHLHGHVLKAGQTSHFHGAYPNLDHLLQNIAGHCACFSLLFWQLSCNKMALIRHKLSFCFIEF